MTKKKKKRSLFHSAVWFLGVLGLSAPFVLSSQDISFPKNPPKVSLTPREAQAEIRQSPAVLVKVPNLVWLVPSQALPELERVNLQGRIGNEGAEANTAWIVVKQSIAPGTEVPPGSLIELTLGEPKLLLQADTLQPGVKQKVHFKVGLIPEWTRPEPPAATYQFIFMKSSDNSSILNAFPPEVEPYPYADHPFAEPGSYSVRVWTIINDRTLKSEPLTIEVQKPEVQVQTAPPAKSTVKTSRHLPPASGELSEHKKDKQAEQQATSSPAPVQPRLVDWRALLKLAIIAIVVLATLVAAYLFRKWRKRTKTEGQLPPSSQATSLKMKVTTGNRQVHAKIPEPQVLKSQCLTRVRWVRGPMSSKITPQDHIVKKKGAAHG
jgi:hypothetical protein